MANTNIPPKQIGWSRESILLHGILTEIDRLSGIAAQISGGGSLTSQKNVTGNVTLDASYNGTIVKVKNNSIITIPTGLPSMFSCVFRTYEGVTATFQNSGGVTMDAPKGMTLEEFKMSTLFKDGNLETFILEGELTTL